MSISSLALVVPSFILAAFCKSGKPTNIEKTVTFARIERAQSSSPHFNPFAFEITINTNRDTLTSHLTFHSLPCYTFNLIPEQVSARFI